MALGAGMIFVGLALLLPDFASGAADAWRIIASPWSWRLRIGAGLMIAGLGLPLLVATARP
jgi:hypothetical protein